MKRKILIIGITFLFVIFIGNYTYDYYFQKSINITDSKIGYSTFLFNAYYGGEKIKHANYDSFKILSYEYAKDKNNVYYGDEIFEGANIDTFELLSNDTRAKDKNHFYYDGRIDD